MMEPESDGDGGRGGGLGGLASAALARGWWLGKKVAFAGAAVTAAPVVIPPLLLFSSIGLAFSIPSGAFFASYVCTDKLMRSLLPLPPHQEEEDEKGNGGESALEAFNLRPEYEGLYNEEEVWEQIVALRTIMGYKADPRLTCTEELEALFLFTGVDPPLSFEDTDLMEVNVMLLFLKSLVGVE